MKMVLPSFGKEVYSKRKKFANLILSIILHNNCQCILIQWVVSLSLELILMLYLFQQYLSYMTIKV